MSDTNPLLDAVQEMIDNTKLDSEFDKLEFRTEMMKQLAGIEQAIKDRPDGAAQFKKYREQTLGQLVGQAMKAADHEVMVLGPFPHDGEDETHYNFFVLEHNGGWGQLHITQSQLIGTSPDEFATFVLATTKQGIAEFDAFELTPMFILRALRDHIGEETFERVVMDADAAQQQREVNDALANLVGGKLPF